MKLKKLAFNMEVKEMTDEGSFSGYGAVFNNVDRGRDIILPGAFKKTLAEREKSGLPLPILWQHDFNHPLGHFTKVAEDEKGLYVEGQLELEVAKAREAKSLMKKRIITGMSIGYGVVDKDYDEVTNVRKLIELDLHEVSLVTFPMNDTARIQAVKRRIEEGALPKTVADFERFLRDAGFSRKHATIIANEGVKSLLQSDSESKEEILAITKAFESFELPTFKL